MSTTENPRPPFPPFDAETAAQKVRMAEDAWNTRNPEQVSLAYTLDSVWRNRSDFLSGREATIPRNNPVNAFTLGGIVRDAGLTTEQFRELL